MATCHDSTTILAAPMWDKCVAGTSQQDDLATEVSIQQDAILLDALEMLDRMSGKAPMFRDAYARVLAGVRITVMEDGLAYQIDGLRVQPNPAHFGWPWRCQCEGVRCWHAALCEALVVVQSEADGAAVTVIVMREG